MVPDEHGTCNRRVYQMKLEREAYAARFPDPSEEDLDKKKRKKREAHQIKFALAAMGKKAFLRHYYQTQNR